jgi:hypothetical protein
MVMLVGDRHATDAELSAAHEWLDLLEWLLCDERVQARLLALGDSVADAPALRSAAERLSADLGHLVTPAELEQHARWSTEHPGAAPLLSCCATLPDEPARKRARKRSETTLAQVVESLCRKAAGEPAGLGRSVAVYRHRLLADMQRLEHDGGHEISAASPEPEPDGCECSTPTRDEDGDCLKCGRWVKATRGPTRSVLTDRHRAQLRAVGWSEERIQAKDRKLTEEALRAEWINTRLRDSRATVDP